MANLPVVEHTKINALRGRSNLPSYLTSERDAMTSLPPVFESRGALPPMPPSHRDLINSTRPNTGASDVPDEHEYLPPNALVPTTTLPSSPPPYSTIYIPEDIDMGLPSYDSLYPGKDNNNPPTSNTRSHPS